LPRAVDFDGMKNKLAAAFLFSSLGFAMPVFAAADFDAEEWDDPKSPTECGLPDFIAQPPYSSTSESEAPPADEPAKRAKPVVRQAPIPTKVATRR
jgi:hypothetical protein